MSQVHTHKLQQVIQNIKRVVVGQDQAIELILIALLLAVTSHGRRPGNWEDDPAEPSPAPLT